MNYTKEQEQAIFLRDKNIMVSAGAGAGKTRVLVSRMAELIMDEKNPVEADRFLVMTFTNAAAAEMKERISLDLEERLAKDPENHYLRKQIRVVLTPPAGNRTIVRGGICFWKGMFCEVCRVVCTRKK